ncbi:MAG TPA: DNRLRE domain-containing protein, partial [Longimicrobium sp.]|nr:DNRLRE domain-containing protein [Longimicrobium sp.]
WSFLRFNVGSLPAPIRSAKVRLHATGETVKGPALHATTGAWAESSVTWQTRPAPSGSAFGTAAAVRAGDWVEYDVTARVRGPGQYDFGLYATSDDGVTLHAREGGIAVARPQLVLELDVPPLATDACGSRPHLSEVEGYVHPDTYVSSAEPTTRFNTRATVRVDGSPREEGYLSVSVPAWSGRLVRAVLRLYADTETVDGPKLYRTAPWSRPDFNWNERPALVGSALADSAQISAGGWVEFDVTAAITGEGTYGFALIPDSSDSVAFISEDAVSAALAPWSLRPHLRLTTESAPTCSRRGTGGATTMTRRVGGGGDELPEAFARAPDGGWVVVGSAANGGVFGGTVVSGSAELVVSRYAADGTHRWTRVLARSGVRARDVVVTGLGNVLMVGTYQGTPDLGTGPLPGPIGGFFAKLSPEGAVVWTRGVTATTCDSDGCYPRDVVPHAVTTDANGSLIASGAFWGLADFGGGPLDAGPASHGWDDAPSGMFVLKLAWDGVHLWSQSMPGRYLGAVGHSLGTDSNGDVLVGAALPTTGIEQPTVLKLSPRGAVLWTRSLQGARGGAGKIAVLPDGSAGFRVRFEGQFTFAGSTYSNTESFGEPDDVLAVVGPDGSERASRGLPGMILEDLTADAQGGLRAVLRLDSSDFAVDLGAGPVGSPAVARFTPSLGVQWYRSFDPNMERLFVDGANVVGAFRLPVLHEGRWLASPNQSWDTLLFQLGP